MDNNNDGANGLGNAGGFQNGEPIRNERLRQPKNKMDFSGEQDDRGKQEFFQNNNYNEVRKPAFVQEEISYTQIGKKNQDFRGNIGGVNQESENFNSRQPNMNENFPRQGQMQTPSDNNPKFINGRELADSKNMEKENFGKGREENQILAE